MIHYNTDTIENGYDQIHGDAEDLDELKGIIFHGGNFPDFPDCVGYIRADNLENTTICVCAVKELGVFLGISLDSEEYLSLSDSERLNEVVDVWGDDLNVSKGLFIPAELAWVGIEELITTGKLSEKIQWISPKELPEEGNYII